MSAASKRDNARRQPGKVGKAKIKRPDHIPPLVTGQCTLILNLIADFRPMISLRLTTDHAIPEAFARVHELRAAGWNIIITIYASVIFRGIERRTVASYSLGTPAWPRPGFFEHEEMTE